MNNPYLKLRETCWTELADLGWQRLRDNPHGDLSTWLDAIDKISQPGAHAELDKGAPTLGVAVDDKLQLRENLMKLHPWRKGPLALGGVRIDTEWRSDWKWNRLKDHLDLEEQRVLDIGCGNGYFGLRMLGAGADMVVGIDPTMVFVMQWLAMQKICPGLSNFVLPLGIEDLPDEVAGFDSVFSMGVLYHRRDPVKHLQRLKSLCRPGGHVLLETLILEGQAEAVLVPEGRYARMRNVHAIPTVPTLVEWLRQAGLEDARVLDVSKTTIEEQRSTEWMTFESLVECLDANDPALTIEGHPSPVRAALLVQV